MAKEKEAKKPEAEAGPSPAELLLVDLFPDLHSAMVNLQTTFPYLAQRLHQKWVRAKALLEEKGLTSEKQMRGEK
jgi:hypothetical protein